MQRYLGLTEQEMTENETMWAEEQGDVETAPADPAGLRSVGVTPGGIQGDLEAAEPPAEGEEGAMAPDASGLGSPVPGGGVSQAPAASIPTPV
jgi:hypothetical protein